MTVWISAMYVTVNQFIFIAGAALTALVVLRVYEFSSGSYLHWAIDVGITILAIGAVLFAKPK